MGLYLGRGRPVIRVGEHKALDLRASLGQDSIK